MRRAVIVSAVRTPIGTFGGAISQVGAADLGAVAIKGCLERISLDPSSVDEVILGNVLQAGQGNVAHQAARKAGIPQECHQ